MMRDPAFPPPSPCQEQGHLWRVTQVKGLYYCHRCRKTGYCPDCRETAPGAERVRCTWHLNHGEKRREA